MVIRAEQMQVFEEAAAKRFENQMVGQLSALFPRISDKLGDPGLREVIQYGVARAGDHGITRQRDVGRYIAIMLMFGPHFDSKPASGPFYAVLRDPRLEGSRARADALCEAAQTALRARARTRSRCWMARACRGSSINSISGNLSSCACIAAT